jgi:hypothetical protein
MGERTECLRSQSEEKSMHWSTNLRFNKLGLLTAVCLAACNESSAPRGTNDVDAAYAALVADVANCAKQVKTCLDAAGSDDAAVATCREDFGTCRAAAGKHATHELASAVRGCTSQHNACVKAAEHGSAGDCQDELRVCLRAAHPDNGSDDADAGSDEGGKGKRSDCLDEMHACVKADGPANTCAEQVRMCVVDSMPSPLEVAPEDYAAEDADEASDEDADEASDEDMAGAGSGMPSDPGMGRGKSADKAAADGGMPSDPGMGHGKPADKGTAGGAGSKGSARKTAARMCVETFSACVDGGTAARSCAQTLKECRAAAKP